MNHPLICAYARGVITFLKTAYHSRKVKFLPVNDIASLMWNSNMTKKRHLSYVWEKSGTHYHWPMCP